MRKVFRWSYAIYYRVKAHERRVEVLRIWDARQAPWKLKLP
jgi:plasmid stabilization system protein ParE